MGDGERVRQEEGTKKTFHRKDIKTSSFKGHSDRLSLVENKLLRRVSRRWKNKKKEGTNEK